MRQNWFLLALNLARTLAGGPQNVKAQTTGQSLEEEVFGGSPDIS
jgi:hypothetical protein